MIGFKSNVQSLNPSLISVGDYILKDYMGIIISMRVEEVKPIDHKWVAIKTKDGITSDLPIDCNVPILVSE